MVDPDPSIIDRGHARLDDRIVGLLERDGGVLAFNGLRRALSAHPESLIRALRRLERYGVVSHADGGYALVRPAGVESGPPRRPAFRAVGSVELPGTLDRDTAFGQLAGRWFGQLRWVGIYESRDDPWLVWTLEGSPDQVYLSLKGRTLAVGVGPAGGTASDALERAAVDLLRLGLARILHPGGAAGSLVTFGAGHMAHFVTPN